MNPNHYLTIYTKDYKEKPIKLVSKNFRFQEFTDPIAEGYRHYLLLDEAAVSLPNEDGEIYVEKFKKKYKSIGNVYFKEPINKDVIFRNKLTKGKVTEYHMNYCDIVKENAYYLERKEQRAFLSDDAKFPMTTYTAHYKEPSIRNPPLLIIPPSDFGVTDQKLKNILNVTIGTTNYHDGIGRLGGIIVRENIHGKINKPSLLPELKQPAKTSKS